MIEAVLLAVAAFASTNIDDAFVLLAFFSDRRFSVTQIVAGQYLGMTLLVAAGLGVAFAALALPSAYISYLGLAPIGIGINRLRIVLGERKHGSATPGVPASGKALASIISVTVANGGDNIGTYAPLFVQHDRIQNTVICLVFATMTGIWCFVGASLVSHPVVGKHIREWGHWVVPFVLIAIGGYILLKSGVVSRL
jgi:cadmium resistance protein CadD (predicted permease)